MVDEQNVQVERRTSVGPSRVMAQLADTVQRPSQRLGPNHIFFLSNFAGLELISRTIEVALCDKYVKILFAGRP